MNWLKEKWENRSYPFWFVMMRIDFHQKWIVHGPLWWACRCCRERKPV